MDRITLKNYRCFHDRANRALGAFDPARGGEQHWQDLLHGDDTGVCGMSPIGKPDQPPDFKEAPYDLGSFDDTGPPPGWKRADGPRLSRRELSLLQELPANLTASMSPSRKVEPFQSRR